MASGLLGLPPEVQRTIPGHLKFHDLTRLRISCRELQQNITHDLVRDSLQQLESDWGASQLPRAESYAYNTGPGSRQTLKAWSYHWDEIARISCRLPCYECLRLRKRDNFFSSETLDEVSKCAAALANSYQQPVEVSTTRKCIDCVLQSSIYRNTAGKRWRAVRHAQGSRTPYWLAVCRACDQRVETNRAPLPRQRDTDLCSQCYSGTHARWMQIRAEVDRRRDEIRQQKSDLDRRDQELDYYLLWMDGVDQGNSVLKHPPRDLEDMEIPDWQEIRPDALVKFPFDWETRH